MLIVKEPAISSISSWGSCDQLVIVNCKSIFLHSNNYNSILDVSIEKFHASILSLCVKALNIFWLAKSLVANIRTAQAVSTMIITYVKTDTLVFVQWGTIIGKDDYVMSMPLNPMYSIVTVSDDKITWTSSSFRITWRLNTGECWMISCYQSSQVVSTNCSDLIILQVVVCCSHIQMIH